MDRDALDRLQDWLASQGLQAALLASPFTLTWLTGYAPPIQTGPSPFEGGPALAWWDGQALTLLLASDEEPNAAAAGVAFRTYLGYSIDEPLTAPARQAEALTTLLRDARRLTGSVGVEVDALTATQYHALQAALPQATLQPIDAPCRELRAVKSTEELTKIRAALALSDLAQATLAQILAPGVSELELWGQIKQRVEREAGERIPVLVDLVAGPRTVEVGGPPSPAVVRPGDAVILDFVPRRNGYWGDNADTHFAGPPTGELARVRSVVWDTLRWAVDQVKPGVVARDLDQAVRARIHAAGYPPYPHHTGHGLGVSYHEEPRIVPYNPLPLAPDMVVALEPGIYLPGVGGVRLEHIVRVTADGCEILTHHLPQ